MAKKDEIQPQDPPPSITPEPAPMPFRLLVNPSGQIIEFNLDDPHWEEYLGKQKPVGLPASKWFREPTDAEVAAFMAARPAAK